MTDTHSDTFLQRPGVFASSLLTYRHPAASRLPISALLARLKSRSHPACVVLRCVASPPRLRCPASPLSAPQAPFIMPQRALRTPHKAEARGPQVHAVLHPRRAPISTRYVPKYAPRPTGRASNLRPPRVYVKQYYLVRSSAFAAHKYAQPSTCLRRMNDR